MDPIEATKIVFSRIQQSEPEYVTNKIIGYIYLHDHADREMIRLAFGPDKLILNLIQTAKIELGLASKPAVSPPQSPSMNQIRIWDPPLQVTPLSPASSWPFSSSSQYRLPTNYWHPQLATEPQRMHNSGCIPIAYSDSISEDSRYQNHTQFMGFNDQLEPANAGFSSFPSDFYHLEAAYGNLSMRDGPQPLILPEHPSNACHYFHKGFCKHGNSCRYFHEHSFPESYPHMFGSVSNEVANEDQLFSPGSLEKLEMEIAEILKSRRGYPVSIASLPMIYHEKYGRTLQAEGYLTESQRHGKAGYSLTKLLARLKNSIRLIDRPHGQHSVILAEDAPKYMENLCERNDPGPIVSGSRQIYLTFPAESSFTEEDVSNYFNNFGPVEDVRIPCQQKRMFGFVTFVVADTVNMILSKGNPHYVCGARVLVKPYREKSKLVDRMYSEKLEPPVYYHPHHVDMDSELDLRWESSRLLRNVMEKHDQPLELEGRRLSELQLPQKPSANQSYFCYSMDELKVSEDGADHSKFPSAERINYLLDVLNSGSTSDDNPKHTSTDYLDQENDLISQIAHLQLQ